MLLPLAENGEYGPTRPGGEPERLMALALP